MFVFCSLILWQPRQLRQRLKHLWDQMVSKKKQTKTVQSNLITSVDQTVKTIYIFRVLDE